MAGSTDAPFWRMIREIRPSLIWVTVLAIITSCLFFARFKSFYFPDSPTYIAPAANMLAGNGFTNAKGEPETIRTPGYPVLILPFLWVHLGLAYLVVFQHVLRIALIAGTFIFAYALTKSRRQAILAGIVLCIDLPFLESANSILTEMLFTVVLSIVVVLLWVESDQRKSSALRCVLIGVLTGALVLVRPIALFFWLPVVVYLIFVTQHKRVKVAAAFLVAFLVIPLSWAAYNFNQSGYFTVSSISGYNVLQYRAAGVLALNDPGHFHVNADRRKSELTDEACQNAPRLEGKACANMSAAEQAQYFTRYGSRIVLQHPVGYLKLTARGVAGTMLDGSEGVLSEATGLDFYLAVKLFLIYTVPAFCLAVLGLWKFYHVDQKFFWLSLLTCVYFVGISAGAESNARFRIPILPIYGVLIAAGIDSVIHKVRSRKSQT